MKIIQLDQLHDNSAAALAAMHGSASLIQRGFVNWPVHRWDSKAVAAMDGTRCVGVICYTIEEALKQIEIDLAYVQPGHPRVLLRLLRGLKRRAKGEWKRVAFTAHVGNDDMRKIGKALGVEPRSVRYEVVI